MIDKTKDFTYLLFCYMHINMWNVSLVWMESDNLLVYIE